MKFIDLPYWVFVWLILMKVESLFIIVQNNLFGEFKAKKKSWFDFGLVEGCGLSSKHEDLPNIKNRSIHLVVTKLSTQNSRPHISE